MQVKIPFLHYNVITNLLKRGVKLHHTLMMTKEQRKERMDIVYPPTPLKNKLKELSAKQNISRNKLYIEGVKLVLEKYANLQQ